MSRSSKTVTQKMSQVVTNKQVHNLSVNNDKNKVIISSVRSTNYSGSEGRRPPAKKRQMVCEECPNSEMQYVQDVNNIPNAKTDGDDNLSTDDNFHFLMSLLPYLREVPKNRKMAIRHKLQRVFVEEQEANNFGDGANNNDENNANTNCLARPALYAAQEQLQLQQAPARPPPPPYPWANAQPVHGDAVNHYAAAATPLQNSTTASAAYGDAQPTLEYANSAVTGQQQQMYNSLTGQQQQLYNSLTGHLKLLNSLTGQQQLLNNFTGQQQLNSSSTGQQLLHNGLDGQQLLQQYANSVNNNCYGDNTNADDNTSFICQPEIGENQKCAYLQ